MKLRSMKDVTVIYGDGIGPEVMNSAVEIIKATGAEINWIEKYAGLKAIEKYGEPLPKETVESIRETGVALKGPITTPVGSGFKSVNVGLRQALTLYANVRPVKTYEGLETSCKYDDIDLIVVRENTEGLYSSVEHDIGDFGAESIRIITEKASKRIAKYAFELARREGRKKVTALHKANILKKTDGLFLRCVNEVAADYPDIELDDLIIDAACMNLVMYPERYDVLLATNLFGDIVSDLCAGLIGGLGLTTGANIGEEGALFEAVHGSAPDIAGQNIANPTACILAGADMLSYIGLEEESAKIKNAVAKIFKSSGSTKAVTKDLGGELSTTEFTKVVIENL